MRGALSDFVIIPVVILSLVVVSMFGIYISGQVLTKAETQMKAVDSGITDAQFDEVFDGATDAISVVGNMIPVIAILLYTISIVASLFTEAHPIFIFISIIFLVIGVFVAMLGKSVYDAIVAEEPLLAPMIPFASWFFVRQPIIISVIGALDIFVIYWKRSGE